MNLSEGLLTVMGSGICALTLGAIIMAFLLLRSREFKALTITGSIFLVAFVFLLCSSIGSVFISAPSPLLEPSVSEVVGSYQLDNSATLLYKNVLHKEGYPLVPTGNTILDLRADKTFFAENMPDLVIDEMNSVSEYVTGRGSWEIKFDSANREWYLYLQFSELNNKSTNPITHLRLYGLQAPYNLYYTVGDPDSHQSIIYIIQK
jgi:hypothetical protein